MGVFAFAKKILNEKLHFLHNFCVKHLSITKLLAVHSLNKVKINYNRNDL